MHEDRVGLRLGFRRAGQSAALPAIERIGDLVLIGDLGLAETLDADAETRSRCCRRCYEVACFDSTQDCAAWADAGQCYLNPDFMQRECCFSCTPDPDNKCAIDFSRRPGVAPGDLDTIFRTL